MRRMWRIETWLFQNNFVGYRIYRKTHDKKKEYHRDFPFCIPLELCDTAAILESAKAWRDLLNSGAIPHDND